MQKVILFLFSVFVLFACSTTQQTANSKAQTVSVDYSMSISADSSLQVYAVILASDLLQFTTSNKMVYNFKLFQYDTIKKIEFARYTSNYNVVNTLTSPQYYQQTFTYPLDLQKNCVLYCEFVVNTNRVIHTKKLTLDSEQKNRFAYVLEEGEEYSWFLPYYFVGDSVSLYNTKYINNTTLHFLTKKDTVWQYISPIQISNNRARFLVSTSGQYALSADSLGKDLQYVFPVVHPTFPKLNTPCEMLTGLSLIDSTQNYDSVVRVVPSCKIELDKKWLQISQNNEQLAKQLIKLYYSRISQANTQFTVSNIGKDTDRGQVLILFGMPLKVENKDLQEVWYYGEQDSLKRFIFEKKIKYNVEDYYLQKNSSTERIFTLGKNLWMQGTVVNLSKMTIQ